MTRIRIAVVLGTVMACSMLAAPAFAVETTYDPAAPQSSITSLITSNAPALIGMTLAVATAAVVFVVFRRGFTAAWGVINGKRRVKA